MSELTDKLDRLAKHGLQPDEFWEDQDRLAVELADGLRTLLPAHDAEIREQAMREQMEADCKVRCIHCLLGAASLPGAVFGHQTSRFGWEPCKANDIRAAWAKAHPESEIKEANVAIVPYATVDGQPCDGNGRMLPEAAK